MSESAIGTARVSRKLLSLSGAAVLIGVAMWSAGIPNASWFEWMRADEQPAPEAVAATFPPAVATQSTAETAAVPTLRLAATTPGRNAYEGTAQLGTDLANPQTYGAGALLENGTILREIYADHVVLTKGDKATVLYVEGVAMAPTAKMAAAANKDLLAVTNEPTFVPKSKPVAAYSEILRGAPHYEDDRLVGFDVYPGANIGLFSRLGLSSGDLLTAVDGQPITDHESLHSVLKELSEGRSVVAHVVRGGEALTLSLDGGIQHQPVQPLTAAMPP